MQRTRRAVVALALLLAAFTAVSVPALVGGDRTGTISTAAAQPQNSSTKPYVVAPPSGPTEEGAQLLAEHQLAVAAFLAQVEAERVRVQLELAEAERVAAEQAAAAARRLATPPPAAQAPAPAPVSSDQGGGSDCDSVHWAAREIYMRESGCRTWAVNPGGCRGIGQACPGSKLPCSDDDFVCQHEWFTGYAMSRYGSWENAWAVWQRQHWW